MNAHNGSVAETRIDEQIGFLFSALLRFLQKDFNGISNKKELRYKEILIKWLKATFAVLFFRQHFQKT